MKLKKNIRVGFTENALKALKEAGITDDIFKQLIKTVQDYPRGEYIVDTFDGLSCLGVPLSWLRIWNKNEAIIMTRAEAMMLDLISVNENDFPFEVNFLF